MCGVGPLVSLTSPCPSSRWSGFRLLEKAVSGVSFVLEAPGHEGPGSPAQEILCGTRVPGVMCSRHEVCLVSGGRGALWLFRVYSGQAVLSSHGSPSPSRAPCFGGALGGAWRPRGVGGAGAQAALLQMGYLKKNGDGSLLYSVVNTAGLDADGACPPPTLSCLLTGPVPGLHALVTCPRLGDV